MKNSTLLTITALLLCFFTACKSGATLDDATAQNLVASYLKANPETENVRIDVGEIKFRGKNDQANLEHYKILDEKGLLKLNLQEQRKKFLSKDSVYIYLVTMTDQSKPFVLELDAHKATVKAINYVLDEGKPTRLEVKNGKTAKITVSLKKEKTDFAIFLKDKGTAGDFITKTYKLKFKKEEGWTIIGE